MNSKDSIIEYIVINEDNDDITCKYVSYNETYYIRSSDDLGVIYVPIEEEDMGDNWAACVLEDEGDIVFDSVLNTYRVIILGDRESWLRIG